MKVEDRLWSRVEKTDGCWFWRGTLAVNGYGVISLGGKPQRTHRVSYKLAYGEIPDGEVVMHICDNPSCVRPDHLRLGSRMENNGDRSQKGRTVSMNGFSLQQRFEFNVEKTDTCWLWKKASGDGRGYGVITEDGVSKFAHRISYELHIGPIPEGMVIMHTCDNPNCVNPKHLVAGTRAQNMQDKLSKGRQPRGSLSGQSKITENQVVEMRRLYTEGTSMTDLAEKYELDSTSIYLAITGVNWSHVPGAVTEPMYGTQEWKDRISKGKMGVLPTPEHLAKIRAARMLRRGIPSWNKGIPMREETKQKLSLVRKGRIPWNKGKATPEAVKVKMLLARRKYFESRSIDAPQAN